MQGRPLARGCGRAGAGAGPGCDDDDNGGGGGGDDGDDGRKWRVAQVLSQVWVAMVDWVVGEAFKDELSNNNHNDDNNNVFWHRVRSDVEPVVQRDLDGSAMKLLQFVIYIYI